MTTGADLLYTMQRRAARALALALTVVTGVVGLISALFWLFSPSAGLLLFIGIVVLVSVGSLLSLWLLPSYPLAQALLPIIATLLLGVIGAVLVFPALRLALPPLIVMVLLIGSIGSKQPQIILGGGLITLLGGALTLIPFSPTFGFEIGPITRFVPALVLAGLCILTTVLLERSASAEQTAIALADQRAAEAEQARQEAEQARQVSDSRASEVQRALDMVQALELPVIHVGVEVLVVPLVGSLDLRRLEALRAGLLRVVAAERARHVVLDMTGIASIDTAVARGLLETSAAVRLLGAQTLVSGIRAHVAQTLTTLDLDLTDLISVADLRSALLLTEQD